MSGYSIDTLEAGRIGEALEARIVDLQGKLRGIDEEKNVLLAAYKGDAAGAFDTVQASWNAGQENINNALGQLRQALSAAVRAYEISDQQAADIMSGAARGL